MPSKSKVCFFFEYPNFHFENRTLLKKFIERLFKKEKRNLGSINYIFCSDKKLLEINRDYLKHDYYTDIITFDLSDSNKIQAEVYISIDRIQQNSKLYTVSFKSELHRVIFHGALHLCGYNDKTSLGAKKMRQKEDEYLKIYFKT